MSNVSIAGYAGWPAYDTFFIMSLSGRSIYDPNPLRPNPNPKKLMLDSCCVCELGPTLTPLLSAAYVNKSPRDKREKISKRKDKGGKNMSGIGGGDSEATCQK